MDDPPPHRSALDDLRIVDGWAADLDAERAARERSRIRSLRRQAEETTNVVGMLLDLAESAAPVVIRAAGCGWSGVLVAVGPDVVELRRERGWALVALEAVTAVEAVGAVRPGSGRSGSGRSAAGLSGRRDAAPGRMLAEALQAIAELQSEVRVACRDGSTSYEGALVMVADGFLVLRTGGAGPATYVLLSAVGAVESAARG